MSGPAADESLDARRVEVFAKLASVRALMDAVRVDALLLTSAANTAWITAGATTHVNDAEEQAALSALVTSDAAIIITDPIEEPRLREEEWLDQLGFTFAIEPWHTRGGELARLTHGMRVASDRPDDSASDGVQRALVTLRATLLVGEQARLREGARLATEVMREVTMALHQGISENWIASQLAAASRKYGGVAIVTLVGSDERIFRYRHPLPTNKTVERYVMLVLCFRYRGLVSALTRSVHFGEPDDSLRATANAVARIDARMIAGTQPRHTLADIYTLAQQAYTDEGHPDAIEQHHQGGPIAYRSREALATPASDWRIAQGQAFAWNPSLRGAKSEDTILLTESGAEILTHMYGWPEWNIETPMGVIQRPAILSVPR